MQTTDILVVLDRSGSMMGMEEDVIGGFNQFLKDQQALEGEAFLTMVKFDTEYEVMHNHVAIKDVPEMTREDFQPRGATALLDAINKAIGTESEFIAKAAPNARPENVTCLIITDGGENSSREVTQEQIKTLITNKQKGPWVFSFLGCSGEDDFTAATSYGVYASNTSNYQKTGGGIRAAFCAQGMHTASIRQHGHNTAKDGNLNMTDLYAQAVQDQDTGNVTTEDGTA